MHIRSQNTPAVCPDGSLESGKEIDPCSVKTGNQKSKKTVDGRFSIIVPIYNTEKYLPECIESIMNQSYQNLEIILVNDGSPGNADEICTKYTQLDDRIKYIKQDNQGVAIARNNGIAKSSGDFIFCIDSDDTIEKEFIEKVSKVFQEKPYDCVVIGKLFQNALKVKSAIPTYGMAISRDILNKYPDVRFQEHMQPCEDGLFSHKLMVLTDKIGFCESAKYFYRYNPESSERTLSAHKMLRDIPQWLSILEDFYTKYNLWNTRRACLLAFIETEPFRRFRNVNFSMKEKKFLFNYIHTFMNKHKLNKAEYAEQLQSFFYKFVMSDSFVAFEIRTFLRYIVKNIFSIQNERRNEIKKKVITLFWIKFKIRCKGE